MIIGLLILSFLIVFRSSGNLEFNICEVKAWTPSKEGNVFYLTIYWKGKMRNAFIFSENIPELDAQYKIVGYDVTRGMWHVILSK